MEKTSVLINNLYTGTTEYVGLKTKSAKLEIYERVTNLIATGISSSFIIGFALFAILFLSLGSAFWLSDVFNSSKLGFFTVGGIYVVVLGIYLLLRDKIAKNRIRNMVLLKVSKSHNNYDSLVEELNTTQLQSVEKEHQLKDNVQELKQNIDTLKEDFKRLKSHFVSEGEEDTEERVGPRIPRVAVTSLIDLLLRKLVLRRASWTKKAIVPILTNTLVTSALFKEKAKTSFLENLKMKFSKLLG